MVKLFGFSLLRNGVQYDYPFRESLQSLAPICEKVYLALGESEDATESAVGGYSFLRLIPNRWDESLRQGGLILSQQTNLALQTLRDEQSSLASAWGIYLQADEVLNEQDYPQIKNDLQQAESCGCDAVRFRYLHFWQSHHHIAINKKWYPHEIRAVKLNSSLESWGDAQSFRGAKKIFESDVPIYHYGHVRESSSYQKKKQGFFRLYAGDAEVAQYQKKIESKDDHTETVTYWGLHPLLMRERIERLGESFTALPFGKVTIVGDPAEYSERLRGQIGAAEVLWLSEKDKRPPADAVVLTRITRWQRWSGQTKVPAKMRSKLAREWSAEFQLILRLSEKGIGLRRR